MKWNDNWRTECKQYYNDCYYRLCECRNTRADLLIIASLMYKYNPNRDKAECLDRILEWVGDWNSQYELTDLTLEQYKEILYNM